MNKLTKNRQKKLSFIAFGIGVSSQSRQMAFVRLPWGRICAAPIAPIIYDRAKFIHQTQGPVINVQSTKFN
jgi:hypothetical protein